MPSLSHSSPSVPPEDKWAAVDQRSSKRPPRSAVLWFFLCVWRKEGWDPEAHALNLAFWPSNRRTQILTEIWKDIQTHRCTDKDLWLGYPWAKQTTVVYLPKCRFIGGSHSQDGVLWKGKQFQDCLEEIDFHEGCERGYKRLGGEKGKSGQDSRSHPSFPSHLFSLPPYTLPKVLAGIISSLELAQALISTSEKGKSGRVFRC